MQLKSSTAAILLIFLGYANDASAIKSTFDADLDGWTTDETGPFQQNGTGGNPDGYLFIDNDEGANNAHIFAPSKFLDDVSAFDGGTLSFDGNLLNSEGNFYSGADDYGTVTIQGQFASATFDLLPGGATPPVNSWETYSVALDSATWGVTPGEWNGILSNVLSLQLSVEAQFGEEAHGIDNFQICRSGDFDLDCDVDGLDFLEWQRDTNVGSLSGWETNYGVSETMVLVTAVPEPATVTLALAGVFLAASRYR